MNLTIRTYSIALQCRQVMLNRLPISESHQSPCIVCCLFNDPLRSIVQTLFRLKHATMRYFYKGDCRKLSVTYKKKIISWSPTRVGWPLLPAGHSLYITQTCWSRTNGTYYFCYSTIFNQNLLTAINHVCRLSFNILWVIAIMINIIRVDIITTCAWL